MTPLPPMVYFCFGSINYQNHETIIRLCDLSPLKWSIHSKKLMLYFHMDDRRDQEILNVLWLGLEESLAEVFYPSQAKMKLNDRFL